MQRTHSFKVSTSRVKGQEYTMEIPTAGQLVQIERQKSALTGGNYGGIMSNKTVGSEQVLNIVDMAAYLSVLCPKLFEELKIDSLMDLDIFDMKQLQDTWEEDCIPWINSWQEVLRESPKKTKEKKSPKKAESEGDDENTREQ